MTSVHELSPARAVRDEHCCEVGCVRGDNEEEEDADAQLCDAGGRRFAVPDVHAEQSVEVRETVGHKVVVEARPPSSRQVLLDSDDQ